MKSHFWAANFNNQKQFEDYFKETYHDDEDFSRCPFVNEQKLEFIDHDFLERIFETNDVNVKTKFAIASYASAWMREFEKRLETRNLQEVNSLVFVNKDEIETPLSVKGKGYFLEYLGVIEY